MKNIFKCLVIAAIPLFATSCLELEPKAQLADGNLWTQPGDFESFANKFYDWFPNFNMVDEGYIHSDMRSDIMMDKSSMNVYANGTNTIPESDGDYTNAYKHIYRCCLLIKNAEKYGNASDIDQYVGEAYFFRAWSYFELLVKFGDVIIVDEPIDVDDPRMNAPRNDRSEVVDLIVSDLQKAAELLRPTSEIDNGRVGREGAQAFLGRVALFEGTWQKFRSNESRGKELLQISADASKKVIESGAFELFAPTALGDSAQKYMFILEDVQCNPAGLNKSANKEYIIKRCYDATLKTMGKNITTGWFANAVFVASKFVDMYLCSDGLPIDKSPRFKGYETLTSEWENRDNRMRYTLMKPGEFYWNNTALSCRIDWTGSAEELAHAKYNKTTNVLVPWGSGYFPQKWATERLCTDRNESYDYPVLRYAEVLLNYAEALYEKDGHISDNDLAMSINLTRKRVNKSMPDLTNAFVTANGLDMRQEIRRERTLELFGEGFRIDDLKRWKTAEKEMPGDFLGIRWIGEWKTKWPNPGKPVNADNQLIMETGRKWEEKHYLYPLPTVQIQLNPNIGQNPGW